MCLLYFVVAIYISTFTTKTFSKSPGPNQSAFECNLPLLFISGTAATRDHPEPLRRVQQERRAERDGGVQAHAEAAREWRGESERGVQQHREHTPGHEDTTQPTKRRQHTGQCCSSLMRVLVFQQYIFAICHEMLNIHLSWRICSKTFQALYHDWALNIPSICKNWCEI